MSSLRSVLLVALGATAAAAQGTSLAGGAYVATTDVESWSKLALDAGNMRDADDFVAKKQIYDNGQNSMKTVNGLSVPRSLASLSLESFDEMKEDAMYSFFRHAYLVLGSQVEGEDLGLFDERPVAEYGNTVVRDLFALNITHIETEAAIILNVWMWCVHELYNVLRACERNDATSKDDMNAALDIAAALWIGAEQPLGDNERGNLLYNLAEIAGARFDQGSAETLVNTAIIEKFKAIQLGIGQGTCSGAGGYIEFRNIVRQVFGLMTVPLVQILIYHIMEPPIRGKSDFIELYTLALAPRLEVCKPIAYEEMLNMFVKGNFAESRKLEAIALIQSTYPCLDITCAEVGEYQSGLVAECADDSTKYTIMAGYPASSNVDQHANIDKDIAQVSVLLKAGANTAAKDYYMHGYNARVDSGTILSLHDLATSDDRSSAASQFSQFTSYFGSSDYADKIILNILEGVAPFDRASTSQVADAGVGALKYMVTYMSSLARFYQAVEVCTAGGGPDSTNLSITLWDQGVAFFVGSLEGNATGGLKGGQLLYGTNKDLCDLFSTCATSGDAEVNEALLQAFAEGSDYLILEQCDEVEGLLEQTIVPGMPVPLIQGTLSSAVVNAQLPAGTKDGSLALGHAFSRSILPMVDVVSPSNAVAINSNMEFQLTSKPVPDGAAAVFRALQTAIVSMKTDCTQIGVYNDGFGGLCADNNGDGNSAPLQAPTSAPIPTFSASPVTQAPYVTAAPKPPTVLGFGRYSFSSDTVTRIADIALDVRDMQQAANASAANATYLNGANAKTLTSTGAGSTVSLSQLSLTAATYMHQDPMFNIYRWALVDEVVFNQIGSGVVAADSAYANIVVSKALSVAADLNLAAETTVVMNVWMEITHDLYSSVRHCETDTAKAPESIDRAMALWLGEGQTDGSFTTGYLMYHITQVAARNFGQNEGESDTNTLLVGLFSNAKETSLTCVDSSDATMDLRAEVAEILVKMTIPLLQNLFYHIDSANENYIELYALAVIPQAIACGESNFFYLRDVLVNESDFNPSDINDDFFEAMKKFQECIRITCDDLLKGMNPAGSLRSLVQNLCYDPASAGRKNLAGFIPTTDVAEMARIDLDILQIGIFMETNAHEAAIDYYVNGYNSKTSSLQKLATSQSRKVVANQYERFATFFGSGNYADTIVVDVLTQKAPFATASRGQLASGAVRALQAIVTYMAILENFYVAVDTCHGANDAVNTGVNLWETGVALYIGSIEGHARGGDLVGDGTFLYSAAKELCSFFGTCEGSSDASINEFLIDALSDGRDLLVDRDCAGAGAIIEQEILGSLPVPLVQGTLFEAYVNDILYNGTESADLASGYMFAQSVLPLMTNSTSVATVKKFMAFNPTAEPLTDFVDDVFDAFVYAIDGMNVDCRDISTLDNTTVCSLYGDSTSADSPPVQPSPNTPTDLGDGLYKTTTYVQDRANIALDLVAIKNALETPTGRNLAQDLYQVGSNSIIYDKDGIKIGLRSFASFSTEATRDMVAEPYFNIFSYALQDATGKYEGKDVRVYADTIINELFLSTDENVRKLAPEGILVLNLWMGLVHELEETLTNCKNKVIADTDGIHSIDEAVAYWIGDGQISGDGQQGHLLYALSERIGEEFGLDENSQTRTNTNILRLFNQARLELSFPSACSENPTTYPRLRQIVNRIIAQMIIPLVQSLIHNLRQNDRVRVKLYAQAFSPLVAACNPTLYAFLRDKLINLTYNAVEVEMVIEKIRSSFDCLGIECDDVGKHTSETENVCVDTPKLNSLAGYRPSNDVRSYALIDLDILECSILLSQNASNACQDIYLYGKHAVVNGVNGAETLSLSQLATTSDRTVVPQYEKFEQYFGSDSKYAETMIIRAMSAINFPGASVSQLRAIAVNSMQYLVLYMAILQEMYAALADCNSNDALKTIDASEAWDRAAALLIGSVEGTADGGTVDGQSFYALTKARCSQFGTCGNSGNSEVNERIISLLYTGRGEVQARSCSALLRAIDEIERLLLVPLMQSTLHFAIQNEKEPAGSQDADLAEGYISSLSILPLVDDANRVSATTIETNLAFQLKSKPMPDGSGAVFNALAAVYAEMGVDCSNVGAANGINACSGATRLNSNGGSSKAGLAVGVVFGVIALSATGLFIFVKRPFGKWSTKTGDDPFFVANSAGELNHNDDLLTGDLNDANVVMSDEVYDKEISEQAPIV